MLRKIADNGAGSVTTTDYLDGFVYVNTTLSYFGTPEGRVVNNGGSLEVEYMLNDQQGNARVTFNGTGTGNSAKVIQENSFYGFGMVMPGSLVGLPSIPNKNLYNGGSEIQNDFSNLPDLMQTFFRNYDAALGRWTGVDPEADGAESLSVYQYAGNNPIMFNDPLGNAPVLGENPGFFDDDAWGIIGRAWDETRENQHKNFDENAIGVLQSQVLNGISIFGDPEAKGTLLNTVVIKATPAPKKAIQRNNKNSIHGEGFDYERLGSIVVTGTDSYGVALTKANAIKTILTGTKIEGKAFKYLTGSGTVVGAIAGGIPAAISIYQDGLNWRNGTAAGLAVLGIVSEFTGLGEAWDGTVGLGIAVGSLSYDVWDATHPAK